MSIFSVCEISYWCSSTLKADLAPCGCGMSMVDGALNNPLGVVSNSKIRSGG